MPRVQPDEPTVPRRPFKVGDLVTIGSESTPYRIIALWRDGDCYRLQNGADVFDHLGSGDLFRYHGNQQP